MRIAVIGAGIGGLVAAAGLQTDGHEVTVFEQRSEPGPDGAGLTLFRNAFDALDVLGLGNVVRGVSSGAIASMRAGQRQPAGAWLITVPHRAAASIRSVHRAELHRALIEQLLPGTLRPRSSAYVCPDGAPEVTVDDAQECYDLVIVADGIHSRNRELLGLDTGLRYAGYTAWRGVTFGAVDLRGEAGETWGRGQIFGIVPLPDDRVYWFGTLTTPPDTTFPYEYETIRNQFAGWHDAVQACIDATPADAVMRHDIYDLAKPLASFTRGRTVLLGDAAHAMTPNLGQGAGQSIEDAATLTLLIRDAGARDLSSVLARYNNIRLKRTSRIMQHSRTAGHLAQASNPILTRIRNTVMRLTPGAAMGALARRVQAWPQPNE